MIDFYRFWAREPHYAEEPPQSKIVACFMFLQEALDYANYCQQRGASYVLTGPYGFRREFTGKA